MSGAVSLHPQACTDVFDRPLRSLRISVTDRCNLRCNYCMPEDDYVWLDRRDILSFAEVHRLVQIFMRLSVQRVRLTGGEPLLRPELASLVTRLVHDLGVPDVALTTNAVLLAQHAAMLRDAGLHRLTVSLDTLRPARFHQLTGRDLHHRVLEGIDAARNAGFASHLKINTVVMRGYNDDEMIDLLEFSRQSQAELRYIEYMDVGGALQWTESKVVSRAQILRRLTCHYGSITELRPRDDGSIGRPPAVSFALPDGLVFGVIASTSVPFCADCDRARLTADGVLYTCLYAEHGLDLRTPLRGGATDRELKALIKTVWTQRTDRGAEQRQGVIDRGPLVQIGALRQDPRLEMHTRGG